MTRNGTDRCWFPNSVLRLLFVFSLSARMHLGAPEFNCLSIRPVESTTKSKTVPYVRFGKSRHRVFILGFRDPDNGLYEHNLHYVVGRKVGKGDKMSSVLPGYRMNTFCVQELVINLSDVLVSCIFLVNLGV